MNEPINNHKNINKTKQYIIYKYIDTHKNEKINKNKLKRNKIHKKKKIK
jgi:hypothetical protein